MDSDGEVGEVERSLERWLARQATRGLPELVLVSLLREAANDLEDRGYVSRRGGRVMQEH